MAILLPLLVVVALRSSSPPTIVSGGISAIVTALVLGGLTWLTMLPLEWVVVKPFVEARIREGLTAPEVKEGFDSGSLMRSPCV
jgi:hypothetical protein